MTVFHSWRLLVAAALVSSGCATHGTLALATKASVDPAALLKSGKSYQELGQVEGKICFEASSVLHHLFQPHDNFSTVVEAALRESGGDALIHVTTSTHRSSYFPIITGQGVAHPTWCTSVRGAAIKFVEEAAPHEETSSPHIALRGR